MSARILVVEDDPAIARVLRDNLGVEGFDVACAMTGASALEAVRASRPDLVLLDLMLPDTDGFQLCSAMHQGGKIPVVMLTARGRKADKLRGLDIGADDYITKPFDLEELFARIRAVLRRARLLVDRLVLGPVTIDFQAQQATRNGRSVHLTDREYRILQVLAERSNGFVSRDELLRAVWGYPELPVSRCVDHAIARLRKKVDPGPQRFIHTVRGDGYRLTPSGAPETTADASE